MSFTLIPTWEHGARRPDPSRFRAGCRNTGMSPPQTTSTITDLTRPPAGFAAGDLAAWVKRLGDADLPVLRSTARQIARLAAAGDEALDTRDVAALVLRDPLMTARLYMHIRRVGGNRQLAEITTVDRMIVMLGVPPFLRAFRDPPLVEDRMRGNTPALAGLIRVMQRARRAADIAGSFAAWRNDIGFEEIMISAMLHDLAEMLVWCYAPGLALEMQGLQDANPQLRSATAQKAVLGVKLIDLQLELVRRWRMPELLVRMMDDSHADNPRVRNVMLAVNIARHSMHGWDNAALPDDFTAAAQLLSTTPEQVADMVMPEEALSA
jgi:HD-like signal output (HDOD) protein